MSRACSCTGRVFTNCGCLVHDPSVIALCLPCWRTRWSGGGMDADPPRVGGWPQETCGLCDRATNQGIYVTLPGQAIDW